jgi:hypothetical protein
MWTALSNLGMPALGGIHTSIPNGAQERHVSKIKPSWDLVLPLWWSFFWRASIYSVVFGAVLGAVGGAFVGAAGYPGAAEATGAFSGYLGSVPASLLALRAALGIHSPEAKQAAATSDQTPDKKSSLLY